MSRFDITPYHDTFSIPIDTGLLGDETSIYQRIGYDTHTRVVNTADAQVRECLIKLGWMPPDEAKRLRAEVERLRRL